MHHLPAIALVYLRLSLLAFGGGVAVLPEMRRAVVLRHGWLTDDQFRDSFALGQLTPGPGMLMVMVAGYHAAGVAGAIVALVSMFLPSSLLTFAVAGSWNRLQRASWRPALQGALGPVTVGLLLAGVYTLARTAISGPVTVLIALGATLLILRWRVSPSIVIGVAALLGVVLLR